MQTQQRSLHTLSSEHHLQQSVKRGLSTRLLYLAVGALLLSPLSLRAEDRVVVHKVAPIYPDMAKRMHITGTVRVVTTVDPAGNVVKVEGLGNNKILSNAAEDAVRRWKFAPGDGTATLTIEITFDF